VRDPSTRVKSCVFVLSDWPSSSTHLDDPAHCMLARVRIHTKHRAKLMKALNCFTTGLQRSSLRRIHHPCSALPRRRHRFPSWLHRARYLHNSIHRAGRHGAHISPCRAAVANFQQTSSSVAAVDDGTKSRRLGNWEYSDPGGWDED
jgi:hypothetical protein